MGLYYLADLVAGANRTGVQAPMPYESQVGASRFEPRRIVHVCGCRRETMSLAVSV